MKHSLFIFCLVVLLCTHTKHVSAQIDSIATIVGDGELSVFVLSSLNSQYYLQDEDVKVVYENQDFDTSKAQFLQPVSAIDFLVSTNTIPIQEHTKGSCCDCDDIRAFPVYVSGIALIHNIGGFFDDPTFTTPLVLDRATIVDIYSGAITKWNHPNITALQNESLVLPDANIAVFYQSCGTSDDIFTKTMSSFSTSWKTLCPTNPAFPAGTGVASDVEMYNSVSGIPNSIGYVEYTVDYPSKQMVQIINRAGTTVSPSTQTFTDASVDFKSLPSLQYNPTSSLICDIVDGNGTNSWPFSGFYYVTLRIKDSADCNKAEKFYSFLRWAVTSLSSHLTATSYGYAVAASDTQQESVKLLNTMTCCSPVAPSTVELTIEGTNLGQNYFVSLATAFFTGNTELIYNETASGSALTDLRDGSILAALSVILPTNDTNIYPIRFMGGALVCIHNLDNITGQADHLTLDRKTVAGIFARSITQWNSPEIVNTNPDLASRLPSQDIIVVPFGNPDLAAIMVAALTKFDPTNAAIFRGLLMDDNSAYSDTIGDVLNTPNSIGCVSYSDTLGTAASIVAMVNAANTTLLKPYSAYITSAMTASATPSLAPADFYLLDAHGTQSWPLCFYIYLLLAVQDSNCTDIATLARFVEWTHTAVATTGLDTTTDLVLPPDSVLQYDENVLLAATCGGSPILYKGSTVFGVGATFPLLVYQSWTISYQAKDSQTEVIYGGKGSYVGIYDVASGLSDFGATEVPLTATDVNKGNLVSVPMMAGAVALIYHLEEIDPTYQLVLSRAVIASIYTLKITRWNDPSIVALNPRVAQDLPDQAIMLIHRSDPNGTGTAYILSKAIKLFDPTSTIRPGASPSWPGDFQLALGSSNVALGVLRQKYTLGYVEVAYATLSNIAYCKIINQAGTTTNPDPTAIQSAMNDFNFGDSLFVDIMDGGGNLSYPLSSYTYVVVQRVWPNTPQAGSVMNFLYWGLTDPVPLRRVSDLGFVPPSAAALNQIQNQLLGVVFSDGSPVLTQLAKGCDGVIGSKQILDACGVCDGDNSTCCKGTPAQVAEYCFPCLYAKDYPPFLLNSYDCDGFVDCDNGEDDLHCRISIIRTSIALCVVAGILIICCFLVGIDIYVHRKEKIFRENNVLFMMIVLLGCIVGYATVFVLSQLTKLTDFVCGVQYWFFGVAFVLTFGAMIAKTYQVYMLHRQNSGDMSAYTNRAILRYVAAALGFVLIILIVWTSFDVPTPRLSYNDPTDGTKQHYICGNNYFTIFASLLAVSLAMILVGGVIISFLSRKIDYEGNESRLIRNTIFSASALAVLVIPLLIAFANEYPFAKVILSNVGLLIIATLIMAIYFAPRLFRFHFSFLNVKGSNSNNNNTNKKGARLLGPIDI